jgi:hypothetical protein
MKTIHNGKYSSLMGAILSGLLGVASFLSPAHAISVLNGCASAEFCTMSELENGGSITIDNKKFDSWTFNGDSESVFTSDSITVKPLEGGVADSAQGLLFAGPGFESKSVDNGPDPTVFDFFGMNYDVSDINGLETLNNYTFSIALFGVSGAVSGGTATEVVNHSTGNEIACGGVAPCQEPFYNQDNPLKSAPFTDETNGQIVNSKAINVETNQVGFTAGDPTGNVGEFTSFEIEQRFSSAQAPIPIPSTMLLFGSGLVGLMGMRRKLKI